MEGPLLLRKRLLRSPSPLLRKLLLLSLSLSHRAHRRKNRRPQRLSKRKRLNRRKLQLRRKLLKGKPLKRKRLLRKKPLKKRFPRKRLPIVAPMSRPDSRRRAPSTGCASTGRSKVVPGLQSHMRRRCILKTSRRQTSGIEVFRLLACSQRRLGQGVLVRDGHLTANSWRCNPHRLAYS